MDDGLMQTKDHAIRVNAQRDLSRYDPGVWSQLKTVRISTQHLARNRIISAKRKHPANMMIDVLRTRVLQALKDHGWRHVAVTSPTRGCGKTFLAANLAVSLARGDSRKVILMDMDLQRPDLANTFGIANPPSMKDYLSGYTLPEEHFLRAGNNLALGLNSSAEVNGSELLLEEVAGEVLQEMDDTLAPDVVLYDLPPALEHDDVIAILPHVDCVLLVAGGGMTTAKHVREVERLIDDHKPLLGVVLNRGEG